MATSVVSLFLDLFCWLALGFGILFNAILIQMIVRHTPKPMRIYSKILLQTCVTALSLLLMMFFFFPCNFITEKGEFEAILYGLVRIKGVEKGIWNLLAFVCFVFLVYVSMFGYVSQFIFRYFLIVRYFNYFPPAEHGLMEDNYVAEILGINLDEQIPLGAFSFNGLQQTVGLYYIIILCTFAYLLMFTLAYHIKKCLDNESKICATSYCSLLTRKRIAMNKQILGISSSRLWCPSSFILTFFFC
ncbi:hypothetical protein niasHS_009864 [Heterodera schachtii]|uniref:Uncharacterized protein n=1 Tax=Heterodera schachtii TaxID=97005 RepID=A0ABD2JAN3_HETSC